MPGTQPAPDPLAHPAGHAARLAEEAAPSPARPAQQPSDRDALPEAGSDAHAAILAESGLFLPGHYLDLYPDLAEAGVDPLEHYCRSGWAEGRVGHPLLDPGFYRETVLVPAGLVVDPLLHYAVLGSAAGAQPNRYFDPSWYRRTHLAPAGSDAEPLVHYLACGEALDLQPAVFFDTAWYRRQHRLGGDESPLQHFLARRHSARVSPVPEFDVSFYCRMRRDVAARGADPFEHYLLFGSKEGQDPSRGFHDGYYRRRYLRGERGANPLLHYLQHRDEPGVLPTLEQGLGHDLRQAGRAGVRRLVFALTWHNGVAIRIEPLRAFLADPSLGFEFSLAWGNERMAAQAGLSPVDRDLLLALRCDDSHDEDICALLAACFADPRYLRHGGRPAVSIPAPPGTQRHCAALARRWARLLPQAVIYVSADAAAG